MTDTNTSDLGYEAIRLVEASKDSLTDDMVSRLAGTASDAMDLVDRINRSGIGNAIPVLAEMANTGDLERLAGLARVYRAAEDSVTDDMIGRLAETAGEGMTLLDKVNRSGLDKAIPVLVRMVENGDLERVAGLARLYAAAEDSVTDDMIGRLGDTAGSMMVLADKLGRSRIEEALPVIDALVENGDLKRVAELVRLVGAAEDALTDDMVGRFAELGGEAVSVLDRLNRSGLGRMVEMVEKLDATGGLDTIVDALPKATEQLGMLRDMATCLECAREEVNTTPAAGGGIGGLMKIMLNKQNQEFLRFVMALGRQFQERCIKAKEE